VTSNNFCYVDNTDTALFKHKLKSCFVLFLLGNFLHFYVAIAIRYCTLFYIVISVD